MKSKLLLFTLLIILVKQSHAQNYPTFGNETKVNITGLTFDAMEPFIAADGNTLFFNSLNAGGNTNLYYATRVNDSTFTYMGLLGGTHDTSSNHLDAVASLDSLNHFFWTSLRDYPAIMENLHKGVYANGNVTDISRVYGNFNIYNFNYPFGWLIMDAAINHEGNFLYYCNARFDFSNTSCVGVPCESKLGIAQKVNDSTFNKLANSDAIFGNINDTLNYILYAPQVSKNGLELYFTRLQKNTFNTEICVAVRSNLTDVFGLPAVIHANLGFLPEAASPTTDQQKIYYHQKDNIGIFHIYLRYRTGVTALENTNNKDEIIVYPNPAQKFINVKLPEPDVPSSIFIYSTLTQEVMKVANTATVDISTLTNGIYFLMIKQADSTFTTKIVKD